jgi:uncharacterized protein YjiS (DUF1127 family)
MAMIFNQPKLPFGAIAVHRVVSTLHDLVERAGAAMAARRTAARLRRLSPAMREDIGLTLADIERIERGERR